MKRISRSAIVERSAADLYALAHAAFCLLTGKPYWFREADEAATPYAFISVVAKGASESARARARRLDVTLPPAFDAWFAKATDKRPASRFESAGEQIAALAVALDLEPPAALPLVPRRPKPRRFTLALVALGGTAIVSAALVPLVCSAPRPAAEQPASTETSSPPAMTLSNATAPPLAQPPVERSVIASASAATAAGSVSAGEPSRAASGSARPARVPSAAKTAPYDPLDEL